MNFEIIRKPAAATEPDPFWSQSSYSIRTQTSSQLDIDARIHNLLRHVPLTLPFHTFAGILLERHQQNFIPFAYLQHIEGMKSTAVRLDILIEQEKLHRYELEHLLIDLGTMIKAMVHHTPPHNKTHTDNRASTERLIRSIVHITRTHHVLTARLKMLDEHPEKLEVKRLVDILLKINYYLEFKRVQAETNLK